jgi:DNA-binding NtrC family response regulator
MVAGVFFAKSMCAKTARFTVQESLEILVGQMHRGGILYDEALLEFKKAFICAALRENQGNLSKTAPALGLHRNTLSRICFALHLNTKSFRPERRRPPKSAHTPITVKHSAR